MGNGYEMINDWAMRSKIKVTQRRS